MSTPSTKTVVSKSHFPLKKRELLGEIVDSRSGAKNVQDKPGTYCHSREEGIYQRLLGWCQQVSRASLKELLLANKDNNCKELVYIEYV